MGNFFGMLPESMAGSRLYGVELDSISGRIAKQLYPKADITVAGLRETTDRRDFFDLAIGNVPFGNYWVNDKAYNKLGFNITTTTFAKALDKVRPGGVVAFVTSRLAQWTPRFHRAPVFSPAGRATGGDPPAETTFRANAGTDVVSDIPVSAGPPAGHRPGLDCKPAGRAEGFTVNQYFLYHPEMVLGDRRNCNTANRLHRGNPIEVDPGTAAARCRAVHSRHLSGGAAGAGRGHRRSLPADPNVKNYSYTVVDGAVYFRENSRMVRS